MSFLGQRVDIRDWVVVSIRVDINVTLILMSFGAGHLVLTIHIIQFGFA